MEMTYYGHTKGTKIKTNPMLTKLICFEKRSVLKFISEHRRRASYTTRISKVNAFQN